MKKGLIRLCGLLILLVFVPSVASGYRRPLPPEIEVLIADSYYTGRNMSIAYEQIEADAAKCGIRLNLVVLDFYSVAEKVLYTQDYDMVMFIGLVGLYNDTWSGIISILDFLDQALVHNNQKFSDDIVLLRSLYYDGACDEELIPIFHEIEAILYEEQFFPTFFWFKREINGYVQHYSFHYIINCDRIQDKAVRQALVYLSDVDLIADLYTESDGVEVFLSSHLFAYSQYHDTTLPDYYYSIGKAKSTLAQAGYRPAHIK
ncbi:MAG: hypothetical protein ACTSQE_08415 [Candidatus Heimdallarchaeaceae archaeon]